jgi:alpha-L-rhamnosidase
MLLEKHYPSWLYPVTMGATTVWERWDSMLPNGKVNTGSMTSFNHYALGAVADWLHSTVGGLRSQDGWRTVLVEPVPGGTVRSAKVSFDGPYGMVVCSWHIHRAKDVFQLELEVPPNSTAVVVLPDMRKGLPLGEEPVGVKVGSGKWAFECPYWVVVGEWPPQRSMVPFWGREECDCFPTEADSRKA